MSFWGMFGAIEPEREFTWNPYDELNDYWRRQPVKFFFDDPTYYTVLAKVPVDEKENRAAMWLTEIMCTDLAKQLEQPAPEFVLPRFVLEESSLNFTDQLADGPIIREYFEKGWHVFLWPLRRS
jgi:hypothetical protein